MKSLKVILWLVVLLGVGGLSLVYSGFYPIGADAPHNPVTYWALETLRERSIAASIKDIEVPPLDDARLLLEGGADYNEMCSGCHMRPGFSTCSSRTSSAVPAAATTKLYSSSPFFSTL